jgi:hypothetical protein
LLGTWLVSTENLRISMENSIHNWSQKCFMNSMRIEKKCYFPIHPLKNDGIFFSCLMETSIILGLLQAPEIVLSNAPVSSFEYFLHMHQLINAQLNIQEESSADLLNPVCHKYSVLCRGHPISSSQGDCQCHSLENLHRQ